VITRNVQACYQSTIVQVERSGAYPKRRPSALGKRTRALKFGLSELHEGGQASRITQVYSDSQRRSGLLCFTHAARTRRGS